MMTRYEIKFRINHEQKTRLLEAARFALREDPHGQDACYRVTSIYYDTKGLDFYWQRVDGQPVRRKLRLRFYGEIDNWQEVALRPCFLELKHRVGESAYKDRLRLTPEGVQRILADAAALRDVRDLVAAEHADQHEALATIEWIHGALGCEPVNVISYRREAWIGLVDSRLRLTFDQMAHAYNPDLDTAIGTHTGLPVICPGEYIMEIKFNYAIPRWMRELVGAHGLFPQRFSKYATGVETLRNPTQRQRSGSFAVGAGFCALRRYQPAKERTPVPVLSLDNTAELGDTAVPPADQFLAAE